MPPLRFHQTLKEAATSPTPRARQRRTPTDFLAYYNIIPPTAASSRASPRISTSMRTTSCSAHSSGTAIVAQRPRVITWIVARVRCAAKAPPVPANGATSLPPNAPRTIRAGLEEASLKSKQGSVAAMWSSVLVLALVTVPDPLRLIATFFVISRPRPVQSLLAYWAGCLTINVLVLLVPLMVLYFTPTLRSFVQDLAGPATVGHSTIRPAQIGLGVLALLVAALMTVRSRARQRANLPTPAGNTSTPVLDSNTPPAISRPLGRAQDAATKGGSAIQRLLGRAYDSWENGSLWVTFWAGMLYSPAQVSIALALIAATGAAIVAQLTAAIAFIVAMLAVVEIILVSCVITPAKTQAVLGRLHDWVQAHLRQVLIAIPAVLGVSQLVAGMGLI